MMSTAHFSHRLVVLLDVSHLLLSSVAPAVYAQAGDTVYLPLIAGGQVPRYQLLFRTQVTVKTSAQWRDLERMNPLILERGDDWALLLADDRQLESLARLRFNPERTDSLEALAAVNPALAVAELLAAVKAASEQLAGRAAARAQAADDPAIAGVYSGLHAALAGLSAAQLAALAAAESADADGDGLTDDQEFFWCTNANRADTDYDRTDDAGEVALLKAWMNNSTTTNVSINLISRLSHANPCPFRHSGKSLGGTNFPTRLGTWWPALFS